MNVAKFPETYKVTREESYEITALSDRRDSVIRHYKGLISIVVNAFWAIALIELLWMLLIQSFKIITWIIARRQPKPFHSLSHDEYVKLRHVIEESGDAHIFKI